MLVEVRRPMLTDEGQLRVGDVVDASTWRNLEAMVRVGYVRPAEEKDLRPRLAEAVGDARKADPAASREMVKKKRAKARTRNKAQAAKA